MNSELRARISADIPAGKIEVEGEQAFVQEAYNSFVERFLKVQPAPLAAAAIKTPHVESQGKAEKSKPAKKSGASSQSNGKLDKNLDLSGINSLPPLKVFLMGYAATTNKQKNVVFVHYLKKMGIEKVNIDHIYTCFDDVGKIPGALKQSLYDTSADGFFILSSIEDIQLSVKGVNWIKENEKIEPSNLS